jgi:hypothetical protein
MRLITRKLYRAFPELDSYDDARCERFIRSARGSFTRDALRAFVRLALGASIAYCLVTGVFLFDAFYLSRRGRGINQGVQGDWIRDLVLFSGIAIGLLFVYLSRDVLLRLRVRHVLRTRGVCQKCGYSLIGLRVDDANVAVCPECETPNEVDHSLGELTIDGAGVKSVAEGVKPILGKPSDHRVWRVIRGVAKWSLLGLASVLILSLATNEIYVQVQANRARAYGQTLTTMQASIEKAAPDRSGRPFWAVTDEIVNLKIKLTTATIQKDHAIPSGWASGTGFSASLVLPSESLSPYQDRHHDEQESVGRRNEALRLLEEYKAGGLFRLIDTLPVCSVGATDPTPGSSMWMPGESYQSNTAHPLADLTLARMKLAFKRSDEVEFGLALEAQLSLADAFSLQPWIMDQMAAGNIESTAMGVVARALRSPERAKFLPEICRVFRVRPHDLPEGYPWETIRIEEQRRIADYFSSPANTRFGMLSTQPAQFLREVLDDDRPILPMLTALGSFASNLKCIDSAVDDTIAGMQQPAGTRGVIILTSPPSPFGPLTYMGISVAQISKRIENITRIRAAMRAWIAVEAFKLRTGYYPAKLDELVGAEVDAAPVDPRWAKPMGYRRLDAGDATLATRVTGPYVLYLLGDQSKADLATTPQFVANREGQLLLVERVDNFLYNLVPTVPERHNVVINGNMEWLKAADGK